MASWIWPISAGWIKRLNAGVTSRAATSWAAVAIV
jgi:hypothetical protein